MLRAVFIRRCYLSHQGTLLLHACARMRLAKGGLEASFSKHALSRGVVQSTSPRQAISYQILAFPGLI